MKCSVAREDGAMVQISTLIVVGVDGENQPPRIGALRALDASPFLPDITGITHAIRNANKMQRRVVARGSHLVNNLLNN